MTERILDLFAGAGGLSLGFEMIKDRNGKQIFELYRAVEIDKYACQTLRTNYGKDKVIEGDLTKKDIQNKIIKECKGKVSVIVGGFPCQSFSLIGTRSGYGKDNERFTNDPRDNLYTEFQKIVEKIKPEVIVMENVKGILSKKDKNGEKIIDKITTGFENLGYNFKNGANKKCSVVNAADFGVPQKRERVILIGIKKSWKDVPAPELIPTHYKPNNKETKISRKNMLPYVTLCEVIGDLPKVVPRITLTGIPKKETEKIKEKNKKVNFGKDRILQDKEKYEKYLESISGSGKKFFDFVRPNGYQFIDHHITRSQQISDIKLFGLMKEGETAAGFVKRKPEHKKLIKYKMNSFKDKYRKQKRNEPSTTVFAHLEKDGNRFIHPVQARTLTPREVARIQSFPDNFIFEGPQSKKFRQIGNAVPPLLGYQIAKEIKCVFEVD